MEADDSEAMVPYFLVAILCTALIRPLPQKKTPILLREHPDMPGKRSVDLWGTICVAILAVFAGSRSGIGTDHSNYSIFYRHLSLDLPWAQVVESSVMEPGFTLLALILKTLGFTSTQFFVALAAITVICVTIPLRRVSLSPRLSMFLYLTLGFYLSQFNTTRQALAVALCLFAVWLIEGRRRSGWLIFIISVSMHYSALVFVVVYFAYWVSRRNIRRATALVLGATTGIAFLLFLPSGRNLVLGLDASYASYLSEGARNAGLGYMLILALYATTLVVTFTSRSQITYPVAPLMLLAGLAFQLLGIQSVVLGRLAAYFNIYIILAFPNAISSYKHRIPFAVIAVLVGLSYLYLHVLSYSDLLPYRSEWWNI